MSHPTADSIAAFAEGTLTAAERAELLAHLDRCQSCRDAVTAANDALLAEKRGADVLVRSSNRILAYAAAIAVAIGLAAVLLIARRPNDTARIAQLLPADHRLVEPRVSGGFRWAPYRGPLRAEGDGADALEMKLGGIAANLAERADAKRSAGAQHSAGVAMLFAGKDSEAVKRLRDAADASPNDAAPWSDLAAAEYADALHAGRPSLYPQALADADHALRLDPQNAEALFNRALILERLGLIAQADEAWQRYLAIDASSAWAAEARTHREKLPRPRADAEFRNVVPRLQRAVAANDDAEVRRIVGAWPLQSRAYGETEWLDVNAPATSRAVGQALVAISGESLLADAVETIDRADVASRAGLAAAHARYRAGRIAYARHQLEPAESQLREAAGELAALHSPMSFEARYYAACIRFDRNDVDGARRELEALRAELPDRYAALRAQTGWELGLCEMTNGDWNAALPLLSDADREFLRLGERNNAAFVETLLGETLGVLGRRDESWTTRIRSLGTLSVEGRDLRLAASIGAASRGELLIGRHDAARAMVRIEEEADRAAKDDVLLADALTRETMLAAKLGDADGARLAEREAAVVAARIADPAMHARASAELAFASGAHAWIDGDGMRARMLLTRAIDAYRAEEHPLYLPESLLLRARAERSLRDDAAAARDLDDAASALESRPVRIAGTLTGSGIFDAGNAIYEDAIALALDRRDVNGAFAYAERAHDAPPSPLLQRLAGTRTAVLEIAVLPREVVLFCVSANGIDVARRPAARESIATLDASALHELLIRPVEPSLAGVRSLIVVPDRRLASIPFAALYDASARRYLVERMSVATATSGGSLQRDDAPSAPRELLAVSLPSSGVALPDALGELREAGEQYATEDALPSTTFSDFAGAAERAEVIHIAGHTRREPGAGEDALMFAGRPVTWSSIAELHLQRARVVVLAACETLRAPDDAGARAFSLGRGFVAAGARNVIGTLTPIADADARTLFAELHRQLARGVAPSAALRETQLQAIAARGSDAWKSLAIITTRIPS